MRKYKVTLLPNPPTTEEWPVEIEAHGYSTQATQGAGMIADFYEEPNSEPFATFARVASVQRIADVEDESKGTQVIIVYTGPDGNAKRKKVWVPERPEAENRHFTIDLREGPCVDWAGPLHA